MSAAGNLFFTADDGSSGRELWVLDECDFEVTNTSDSGPGSLRQAILDSNAHANNPPERPDYICFDIPGGGVHTINLLSSLPPITQPLVIDGRTQPGYVLDPVIELRGASAALTGLSFTNTGNFKAIALAFNNLKFGIDITNGQNGVTLLLNTFIQIDTAGINAYLKTSGKYQFKQNRFTGNMLVGTKIDFDTNLTVTVEYNRNFHIGNKLGVSVRDSVNGKIDLISTGNSATNCENAGKLEIRANGNWNLDNNIWKASVNAAWTYEALLGPGTSARIRSLNEVVAGNGGDGMKVTANLSANAQFVHDVYGLISDHNGGRGYNVAVFGGPGIKASFNGYGWNVSGNVGGGIGIFNGSALLVGVKANIERSFITGNLDKGVVLTFLDSGDPILNNTITGNTGGAIRLDGGTIARIENNTISGSPIGIEVADNSIGIINNNSISANATAGVLVKDTASASLTGNTITGNGAGVALTGSGVGISIAGNAIYGNTGLGIDLGNDGVTLNDPGDADTGPNNLQNFPVLTSAVNAGGSSTVNGTLNSAANSAYTLRFFVNTGCHPSGYGEGAVFIGSTNVMTDGSGNASFTFVPASALAPGLFVTATATDAANNTSEFSQCRPVGAAAAPLLMVSQPDQSLVLISWPGSAPGFVLDFTTNLANPTSWSPVTTPVVMVNGQFTISITATNQREFFRLRQP
jgi:parallel beta-helix repeat protein